MALALYSKLNALGTTFGNRAVFVVSSRDPVLLKSRRFMKKKPFSLGVILIFSKANDTSALSLWYLFKTNFATCTALSVRPFVCGW